jgi:hypothetical protein
MKATFVTMVETAKAVSAKKRSLVDQVKVLQAALREEKIAKEKSEISKQKLRKTVDDLSTKKEVVRSDFLETRTVHAAVVVAAVVVAAAVVAAVVVVVVGVAVGVVYKPDAAHSERVSFAL